MYMKFVRVENSRFWIAKHNGWYIPANSLLHAHMRIASPSLVNRFSQHELETIYNKF